MRHSRPLGHQPPTNRVAVHNREIAVQHHDVIVDNCGAGERLLAIERKIDGHPSTPQTPRDRQGKPGMIFDQ